MVSMYSMNNNQAQSGNYFQSVNQKYGCGEIDFGKLAYDRPYPIEVTPRDVFVRKKENWLEKFYRCFLK